MKCPRCHADNRDGARFCRECGATFAAACPSCGAKVEAGSKFCDSCGAGLAATPGLPAAASQFASPESYTPKHLAEKIRMSKSALEGERKQVTVLFADLKGSMKIIQGLDPWVDPSTLEFLTLLVDQGPTARILALFTFHPDFSPPWTGRSHLTQVTVHRLPRRQAVEVIHQVVHSKPLPSEVVEQIVAKTDGVPCLWRS